MRNNRKTSKETIDVIKILYEQGKGTEYIAKTLSLHPSTVQKHLKRLGILKSKQKYHHQCDFFDDFTVDSCYWAGMMMSDGYVRENRNMFGIHLKSCDKQHLHNFLHVIKSNNLLIYDTHTDAHCVQIYGKQCKQGLMTNFNIIPNKSKTARYPTTVPTNMHAHFIRGVIDGDGSITYTTVPTVSIVGTVDLLESINDIISNNVDILMRSKNKTKPTITIRDADKPWFGSVSFYGKNAAKLLRWIYSESSEFNRLERKYETYLRLFNEYL